MKKINSAGKILAAVFSYLYKYRPYMTIWTIAWIVGGIWMSVNGSSVWGIIIAAFFILVPVLIRKGLWLLNRMTTPWNRLDSEKFERKKGRFTGYITQYMEK